MDFCRSASVSRENCPEEPRSPTCSKFGGLTDNLDDLLAGHNMAQTQEADVSLEWLSIFVEDCLYDTGHCQLPAAQSSSTNPVQKATSSQPSELLKNKNQRPSSSVPKLGISFPGKVRSKRPRPKVRAPLANWAGQVHLKNSPLYFQAFQVNMETACDPPLLQQSCWLAESELIIVPKNESHPKEEEEEANKRNNPSRANRPLQQRRCSHCLAHRTPQWRAGPLGPKTLCNACGVRYKSGRLLPEYRPAKSPTFVSFKHSNSHKKVMELRNEPERHGKEGPWGGKEKSISSFSYTKGLCK